MKIKHKLNIFLALLLALSQTGTLYAQNAKTKKAVKEEGKEIAKEELAKYEDLAQAVEELKKTKKQLEEAKEQLDEAKKTPNTKITSFLVGKWNGIIIAGEKDFVESRDS